MISFLLTFRGELSAIAAALIWAIASVIYTRMGQMFSPVLLNLLKGIVAIVLLGLTLVWMGGLLPSVSLSVVIILLLSGIIGIGIGDTAYFQSLNYLGARRTLILESTAPVFSAILAWVFLNEQLQARTLMGMALTIAGVLWVVLERSPHTEKPVYLWPGIGYGLLAGVGQAGGVVLSRSVLAGTNLDPLWTTFVRLCAGILMLAIWGQIQGQSIEELKPLRSRKLLFTLIITAFLSTYVAIWLQQVSLKYSVTGISQSLSATGPLFITVIALLMGERVSMQAIVGMVIALVGIWLLFSRG